MPLLSMTLKEGINRINTFGGFRLVIEYFRMGLAWKISKQFIWNIFHGKPIKNVYYETNSMVASFLLRKYEDLIQRNIDRYNEQNLKHERTDKLWFCWLQGKENMPEIIRACYNSQKRYISGRDMVFIDGNNWREYVSIPDYLVVKYKKGIIPKAMFSDLIRLELLINYGGTWLDATVLCTGGYDPALMDTDIFVYRYGKNKGLSNWFITSCTNNPILMVIRDVLHQYWKDYNVVVNYYIFHLVFGRLMKEYPEMIDKMPYADSYGAINLAINLHKPYNEGVWKRVNESVHFHKLTSIINDKLKSDRSNYYNFIVQTYS